MDPFATFVVGIFLFVGAVFVAAVAFRARRYRDRWDGWESLAAVRGLEAVKGDPLGIRWTIEGANVVRTLHGRLDGRPVAAVVTVRPTGSRDDLSARSDLLGIAQVGGPVPLERVSAALAGDEVAVTLVGDLLVLTPGRPPVHLAGDHPAPEEAARMIDLAALAARAAQA